jgi:protease I
MRLRHEKSRLDGKKVAMLVTNGLEQVELTGPKDALEQAGARVDVPLKRDRVEDYNALVLPGGVMNPNRFWSILNRRRLPRSGISVFSVFPFQVMAVGSRQT